MQMDMRTASTMYMYSSGGASREKVTRITRDRCDAGGEGCAWEREGGGTEACKSSRTSQRRACTEAIATLLCIPVTADGKGAKEAAVTRL